MRVSYIDRTKLKNDEHFQLNTEFRDLINRLGAQELKIQTQFDAYLPLYDKEDEGIKRIAKSALTAKIHQADKARDDIYTGMVELNAATMTYHYNVTVRDAAKRLKILFDTYGNISHKPLNEQTSAIHNILQELKGEYLDATQAVKINDWVNQLEARNNVFDSLVKERFDEAAAKSHVVVRTARRELDAAYDTIVERINALAVVEGVEQYETFIQTLNTIIAKYTAILHARLGRKHHKPEDGGGSEGGNGEGENEDNNDEQAGEGDS